MEAKIYYIIGVILVGAGILAMLLNGQILNGSLITAVGVIVIALGIKKEKKSKTPDDKA